MKKLLYLDLVGGLAGDMLVGGLLDLGMPWELLEQGLQALNVPGLYFQAQKELRHQIQGTRFIVDYRSPAASAEAHRSFREIRQLLQASPLKPSVQTLALRIFEKLALAEGQIHDCEPESVHFHEVGAWDSIADIVGVALGLDYFQVDAILVSPVPTGTGFVEVAHGRMPIPAPATLLLLQGFEVLQDSLKFERTTPTGAAILAAVAQPRPESFCYRLERVGIGIGTKKIAEVPNLVRCLLGTQAEAPTREAEIVECCAANLDDCSPEWLGYTHERLMAVGALDVWWTSIQMKKQRPGVMLQVLYEPSLREAIHTLIFSETTTLGIRYQTWERHILPRQSIGFQTPWGLIRGKVIQTPAGPRFSPEFEDCRQMAQAHHLALPEVYRLVETHFWQTKSSEFIEKDQP